MARHLQVDLGSDAHLTPHIQTSADEIRALAHTGQTKVFAGSVQPFQIDAAAVVANAHLQLFLVEPDFHLDLTRMCVMEGIAERLANNPMHIVSQHWMERPWRSLYGHPDKRWRLAGFDVGGELLSQCRNRVGQIFGFGGRRSQVLYSVTTLGQGLRRMIDGGFKLLLASTGRSGSMLLAAWKRNSRP